MRYFFVFNTLFEVTWILYTIVNNWSKAPVTRSYGPIYNC